jgi:predicted amidohydrolase
MDKFRLAVVQMNALKDDLEHNIHTHIRIIEETARAECDLVVFPELSVTAHYGDEAVVQFAEEATGGRIFQTMLGQAKKHNMVIGYGFCESAHGTYYNSHALVGPEGMIGVQRKVHASYDEYFNFRMGRSFETFDLGFCKVGTLICYDVAFCESWRVLALRGVEVVLVPQAGRSGYAEKISPGDQIKQLKKFLRGLPAPYGAYARENGVFAAHCNQVGFNGHSTHSGGAYILGPTGELIEKSKPVLDDLWVGAELDPELQEEARRSCWFTLKTRRPEVYGELTRMI